MSMSDNVQMQRSRDDHTSRAGGHHGMQPGEPKGEDRGEGVWESDEPTARTEQE